MKSVLTIDKKKLERGKAYTRDYIRGSNLDDAVREYAEYSQEQERDAKLAMEALATFGGAYIALRHCYKKGDFFDGSEPYQTQNFLDIPACFGATLVGLKYLQEHEPDLDDNADDDVSFRKFEFKPTFGSQDDRINRFLDNAVENYYDGIKKAVDGTGALYLTKSFFEQIKRCALDARKAYPEHSRTVDAYTIKIDGIVMEGFKDIQGHAAPNIIDIREGEDEIFVAGNEEAKLVLDTSLTYALCYEALEKQNVMHERYRFPRIILFYGPPGTGKTTTIQSRVQKFGRVASQFNKKLYYKDISNCFKSEYISKSANNLKEIFDGVKNSDGVWYIWCDDIDTVFFSREDSKERPDEKANLEVLMHFIEAAALEKHQNFIFVATTNHRDLLDDAVESRLGKKVLVSGPKTVDDYEGLFKYKLKSGLEIGYVQVKNWERIGKACQKHEISGREVAKMCENFASQKEEIKPPHEVIGMMDEDRVETMDRLFSQNPITDRDFYDAIEETLRNRDSKVVEKFENDVKKAAYQMKVESEAEKKLRGN